MSGHAVKKGNAKSECISIAIDGGEIKPKILHGLRGIQRDSTTSINNKLCATSAMNYRAFDVHQDLNLVQNNPNQQSLTEQSFFQYACTHKIESSWVQLNV